MSQTFKELRSVIKEVNTKLKEQTQLNEQLKVELEKNKTLMVAANKAMVKDKQTIQSLNIMLASYKNVLKDSI